MNIIISTDNKTVDPTFVLLNSIKSNNPHSNIHIHLLHCELSDKNRDQLTSYCKKHSLQISDYFFDSKVVKKLRGTMAPNRITATTLLRCYMAKVLPKSLDRVLYLDIDTIVISPLEELFEINLNGKIAGVVKGIAKTHLEKFGVEKDNYFNAGVMLVDMKLWRKQSIEKTALSLLHENPEQCKFMDQCALNYALFSKTHFLSSKWNVMAHNKELISRLLDVGIVHFVGKRKPWVNPEYHPFGLHYSIYSKNTPAPIGFDHTLLYPKKDPWLSRRLKRIQKYFRRIIFALTQRT